MIKEKQIENLIEHLASKTPLTEHNALKIEVTNKANRVHTHTKSQITDLNKLLTSEDLNNIKTMGFYYAGGNNTVTNKPSGVDAFGLEVIQSANGWYTQFLYASNNVMKSYRRWFNANTWTAWTEDKLIDTWRGIQNNLTSNSTTDSLSAAQGKALKALVDGKAELEHTHSYLPLSGGTMSGSIITPKNNNMGIIPDTNNYGQIGSSDKKFYRMYATTFYGNLSGNASTATALSSSAGSTTQPVYFSNGKPVACDMPNIRKNPDATDGDIISTHLTVGSRKGDIGTNSIVVGGDEESGPNEASGDLSAVLGGSGNVASGYGSAVIGGTDNTARGDHSVVIGGLYNTALASQLKTGHYSKDGTAGAISGTKGDAFIIGNGTGDTAHSNCFRVAYNGSVYGTSAFNSTGADYAEYFEWLDGNPNNEDRRGLFVALEGDKICIANTGDEIIGVTSAVPSVVGNAYDDQWQGMYLIDVFGQPLTHVVHHDAEYREIEVPDKDEEGNILETTHIEQLVVHEKYDAEEYIINPDYNSKQEYIPRSQRKEWGVVGMFGQIITTDDGSCIVGGYCTVGTNGIGTSTEDKSVGYKVLKRLDNTHVKILFK